MLNLDELLKTEVNLTEIALLLEKHTIPQLSRIYDYRELLSAHLTTLFLSEEDCFSIATNITQLIQKPGVEDEIINWAIWALGHYNNLYSVRIISQFLFDSFNSNKNNDSVFVAIDALYSLMIYRPRTEDIERQDILKLAGIEQALEKLLTIREDYTDKIQEVLFFLKGDYKLFKVSNRKYQYSKVSFLTGHSDRVLSVAFSSDGGLLASGSADGTVKLWDAITCKELITLPHGNTSINTVAFSSDNRLLASGSADGAVRLWDAKTFNEIVTLSESNSGINTIAFSSDGRLLASGSADGTVICRNLETYTKINNINTSNCSIEAVIFLESRNQVILALRKKKSNAGEVQFWDSRLEQLFLSVENRSGSINSLVFLGEEQTLITASGNYQSNKVKFYKLYNRKPMKGLKGHAGPINDIVQMDNNSLASCSNFELNSVRIWHTKTGELLGVINHSFSINSLDYNFQHQLLAGASNDCSVKLWEF